MREVVQDSEMKQMVPGVNRTELLQTPSKEESEKSEFCMQEIVSPFRNLTLRANNSKDQSGRDWTINPQ